MKKLMLLMVVGLIVSLASAQQVSKEKVPSEVQLAFKQLFPNVKAEKWEKEGNHFEVEFKLDQTEQSVLFDAQGNLIETEIEMAVSQLPDGAKAYIKTHYQNQKIKESAKITSAAGVVTYEVEIKGKDLIFDANGVFIREVRN